MRVLTSSVFVCVVLVFTLPVQAGQKEPSGKLPCRSGVSCLSRP